MCARAGSWPQQLLYFMECYSVKYMLVAKLVQAPRPAGFRVEFCVTHVVTRANIRHRVIVSESDLLYCLYLTKPHKKGWILHPSSPQLPQRLHTHLHQLAVQTHVQGQVLWTDRNKMRVLYLGHMYKARFCGQIETR